MLAIYERKEVGVSLCVCFNKDEKSIQVVIFIFFFRFVSFLVRLCMGLRFFLFCSWFFGLARGLYLCLVILSMVGGLGWQASVAKERGWLWDGRKYATELLLAYLG